MEISMSWSLNGGHLYIDNDSLNERQVHVHFMLEGADQSKERKISVLGKIVEELKRS